MRCNLMTFRESTSRHTFDTFERIVSKYYKYKNIGELQIRVTDPWSPLLRCYNERYIHSQLTEQIRSSDFYSAKDYVRLSTGKVGAIVILAPSMKKYVLCTLKCVPVSLIKEGKRRRIPIISILVALIRKANNQRSIPHVHLVFIV